MDLETYSRQHPHFYGDGAAMPPLREALAGRAGTFLDIGTGDGSKLEALLRTGLLEGFDRIIGVDLSPVRIDHLHARLPQVEGLVADACSLPLEDASVDVLYSDQVIEHVPDDNEMALEIARVLKKGGSAIIGSVLRSPGAWYIYKVDGERRLDPTHVREYSNAVDYGSVFVRAGLRVTSTLCVPLNFPVADLLLRLLIKFGLIAPAFALTLYSKLPFSQLLRRPRLTIPRYELVYAFVEK